MEGILHDVFNYRDFNRNCMASVGMGYIGVMIVREITEKLEALG